MHINRVVMFVGKQFSLLTALSFIFSPQPLTRHTPTFPILPPSATHRRQSPIEIPDFRHQNLRSVWMADCKKHGNGGNKTDLGIKTNPSSIVFSRSMTAVEVEVEEKTAAFQRNGSIKPLHGAGCSTFGSQDSPSSLPPSMWDFSPVKLPGTEDRVVIYFTRLRGVRRTFHDCDSVRMIFRGFRVKVDERDASMDVAYKKEMEELFGEKVRLPQVFIKGKHIGGAELVMNLLEEGDLVRMMKGLPLRSLKPCDVCDDVRFMACVNCAGSRKVFDEANNTNNKCPVCNENGLMRCPLCSS